MNQTITDTTRKDDDLLTLLHLMEARKISEASMLDYLKEEGRIADFVTRLVDVPAPVIEGVVTSWMAMLEEI